MLTNEDKDNLYFKLIRAEDNTWKQLLRVEELEYVAELEKQLFPKYQKLLTEVKEMIIEEQNQKINK